MRLGCCLLCISLLLGLACPLRAHAVATEIVISLVAAYLASCGYNLAAHDMNASGTSNAMAKMITDFLDTELGGVSITEWALTWFTTGVNIQSGTLFLTTPAANALRQFANWAVGKYGDTPGAEAVVYSDQYFTAVDGKTYALTVPVNPVPYDPDYTFDNSPWFHTTDFQAGTTLIVPSIDFNDDVVIPITSDESLIFFMRNSTVRWKFSTSLISHDFFRIKFPERFPTNVSFVINPKGYLVVGYFIPDSSHAATSTYGPGFVYFNDVTPIKATDLNLSGGSLTMGVLQGLTVPRELVYGETLKLNLGNSAIDTPEALTDSVIGGIQAGDFSAEAEIVDAVDVPIDPPVEPTAPDIDGLGLPALGAALVSRFPFSIPWDVAKGVQLLAAPAKAPYWEVDFLAPISYRVGGWQGDTTVVIDMSEFEIIGQLSRWTSTIGFCLLLASGTKRLIWTA